MISIALIAVLGSVTTLSIFRWGRLSREVKNLKEQLKTKDREIEILQKQRDLNLMSVADADRMWDEIEGD